MHTHVHMHTHTRTHTHARTHTHTQGSVNLTLHSTPTTAPTLNTQGTDLGLLYGAIFATLIIACVIVVMAILVLKYVQMTRRDTDKGKQDTIVTHGGCGTVPLVLITGRGIVIPLMLITGRGIVIPLVDYWAWHYNTTHVDHWAWHYNTTHVDHWAWHCNTSGRCSTIG